ncbi:MAG TPA: phosphotransferase [Stellaceae bacterium]|jgi:predicted hotdog family 3-hydroxylacyl-ACP dehydratase|nr:phosphotransferase [Stellaceae bacterium]
MTGSSAIGRGSIGREEIEKLIPHAGSMCLLDAVIDWAPSSIRCRAGSHRSANNPLAAFGRLGAACGIEYAAQAMALHGGLTSGATTRPRGGYLASLRSLILYRSRLDDLPGDILIEAERLSGEGSSVSYRFEISHDGERLVTGRAAVILDVEAV